MADVKRAFDRTVFSAAAIFRRELLVSYSRGETNGVYNAEFPAGTLVKITNRRLLDKFRREGKYHHPLPS